MKKLLMALAAITALSGVTAHAFDGPEQGNEPQIADKNNDDKTTGEKDDQKGAIEKDAYASNCTLRFHASGGGLQFIIGYFEMTGHGTLKCTDAAGVASALPVRVRLGGPLITLNIAFGVLSLNGVARGVGLAQSPEAVYGTYYATSMQVAVLVGVGASTRFRSEDHSGSLDVLLRHEHGLGYQGGFNKLVIMPARY